MKKALWAAVLFFSIMMASSAAFAAERPGDETHKVAAEFAAPAYGTSVLSPEREAEALYVAEVTEVWQGFVEALAPSTYGHNVRVDNYSDVNELGLIYESEGSGVIMAMDGNMVYIATAAHCLKRRHTVVEFADGSRHEALVGYQNSAKDVGFLLVPQSELKESTLAVISPAVGGDAEAIGKVQGDVLFALNSSDEPNKSIFAGVLDEYRVVYPNNPSQEVLQFLSSVRYGSSGGAVYTSEGIWVGCVSGGDTFGTCWAVPYADILNELHIWLSELAAQQANVAA